MSAINGKYMYNLTTGETIGIRKSKTTEEDGLTGNEKTRGIFNSDSEDSSGGWVDYYMLGNNDVSSASGIQYGSVEDLSFPQLIDLFLSGNLVPDELKVGLASKGATNINIQNNGNMVVATFYYENKEYTLKCVADAAASQVDNITVDDYENNISVTSGGCRVYENWDGQIRGQGAGERIQLTLWNNGSGFEESYSLLNIKDTLGPDGLDIVNEHPIDEIFIEQFFGVSDIDDLTDEQIKFVNDHPEIFHLTNFSKGGCAYDASMTQMVIDTFFGTDLWLSPEELYCGRIESFKSSIESKNTKGYYGVINQMQLDGNTVSWNDDTVSYILDYLKSPAPFGDEQEKKYVMDLYGFNTNDDAETIKQKLQKFFKANGSADGKSMHIEDYYLSTKVAIARMEGDNFPYTYEEIVKQQEEFLNKVRTESSKEKSSYPSYDGVDLIAFIQEYYNNGSSEFNMPTIEPVNISNYSSGGSTGSNGTGNRSGGNGANSYTVNEGEYGSELVLTLNDRGVDYNSVTPVTATVIPSGEYSEEYYRRAKEIEMNKLLSDIRVWSGDLSTHDVIYQVDIDSNGNIVFGEKFKAAVMEYLKTSSWPVDGFLNLLGISRSEVSVYANDKAKLDELISAFLQKNGSADGKTLTLEQYYDALVVDRGNNVYAANKYKDEDDLKDYARMSNFIDNVKAAYPDIDQCYLDAFETFYFTGTDADFDFRYFEELENGPLGKILVLAAGITPNDSNTIKKAKLDRIYNYIGVQQNEQLYCKSGDVNMILLAQYLFGKNPEGINYFATMDKIEEAEGELLKQKTDYMQNYSSDDVDPSIEVEEVSAASPTQDPTDSEREISQYMGELTRLLYARYFAYDPSAPAYKYLVNNMAESTSKNIDSSKNGYEPWSWKNEEDREAFWSAMQDIINKVMEKYGDSISAIYFANNEPVIILKNGKRLSGLASGSYNEYIPDDLRAEGYQMVAPWQTTRCQEVTNHPILVTDNIEVYENDIPKKAPVDKNGDAMIPTQWPGIYVSKERKVYAWDSVNNKYKGLNSSIDGLGLLCGKLGALAPSYLYSLSSDEYDLIIPLLFGLKRTNYQNVYADDNGKFYRLASASSGEYRLTEIDVIGLNSSTQSGGSNAPAFNDDGENEGNAGKNTNSILKKLGKSRFENSKIKQTSEISKQKDTIKSDVSPLAASEIKGVQKTSPAETPDPTKTEPAPTTPEVTATTESTNTRRASQGNEGCRVYENWNGPIRGQGVGEQINLTNWRNGSGFTESYSLLNIQQTLGKDGLWLVDEFSIIDLFITQYFGVSDIDDLTDEQIKFVNNHPEIFHLTNFSRGGWSCDASITQLVIDTFFNTDLWLSPEELYCGRIETLKSSIESKNTKGYYGVINQMQLDDNTVSWNDDTVSYILDYLKSPAPFGDEQKKKYLMDLFGFTVNDDAETVKQKLQEFFKANGSSDGKSMHIEDYYLATKVAIARMEGDVFPYTYEEIVKQQEEFLNEVRTESSKEKSSYPSYDGVDLIGFILARYNGNPVTIEPTGGNNAGGSNRSSGEGNGSLSTVDGTYSYTVNEGGYGSEIILQPNDRVIDYNSVQKVKATVIPEDDYVRKDGESDIDYQTNRWNNIAEKLLAAFPDDTHTLDFYLSQMGSLAKFGPVTFELDGTTLDKLFDGSGWTEVLFLAAGIEPSDTNKEKEAKLLNFFKKVGSVDTSKSPSEATYDMVTMLQYLAGKNSQGVNYFATMLNINKAEQKKLQEIRDNMESYSSDNVDPSIEVEEASSVQPAADGSNDDLVNEIRQYMGEQLRTIYARYFARLHDDYIFKYFELNPSDETTGNIDSSKNQTEYLTWKNEEDRQAFWSAIQDVIKNVMEKYGDSISNIYFDGDQPCFTLKGSSEAHTGLVGGSYNDYIPYDLRAEGYQMVDVLTGSRHEDATDHHVIFTTNLEVYETDISNKAPVDKNGEAMLPTKWPGLYVAKDGKVYAWDSVDKKYKGLSSNLSGEELLAGKYSLENVQLDLLVPLLYGLKKTNQPGLYQAKDGKFYTISSSYTGKISLVETDVVELNPSANARDFEPEVQDDEDDPEEPPVDEPETTPTTQSAPTRRISPQISFRKFDDRSILDPEIRKFDNNTVVKDDEKVVPTLNSDEPEETEPEELMTSEDYKKEAKDNVEELQRKVGTVISEHGLYYNVVGGKRYNYVWDPFEHKWLSYDSDDLRSGKPGSKSDKTLMKIRMIAAALKLGLIFTVNPKICKDSNGNFYDFDETTGTFKKRVK